MALANIERKLTGKNQAKEDMVLALSSRSNWMQQLVPAPTAVATLAQLALLSTSHDDFELVRPEKGFQYVNHPKSFKACLMQVANEGYEAFEESHVGMDAIRFATMGIPEEMKNAINILVRGNDRDRQVFLPKSLKSISSAANVCLLRSGQIVEKYDSVMKLVDELNETGMSTKGHNEQTKAEEELKKKNEELQVKHLEEWKEKQEAEVKVFKEMLTKREREYEQALNDLPSPLGLLGLKFLEGVSDAATGALSIMRPSSWAKGAINMATGAANLITGEAAPNQEVETERMTNQTMLVYTMGLKLHADQISKALDTLFDEKGFCKDQKILMGLNFMFDAARKNLADPAVNSDLKLEVQVFYDKVKSTLEKVDFHDDTNVQAVKDELKELHMTAIGLKAQADSVLGSSLQKATPEGVKAGMKAEKKADGIQEHAVRNAQAKFDTTREMFNTAKDDYAKTTQSLLETNKKLNESLLKISQLDASTASLRDILDMLQEGLKLLTKLKDQWSKLSLFFQEMANLIKMASDKTKQFVDYAKEGELSSYAKNQVYVYARESVTIGYVVHRIASGYFEFSRDHLMAPVSQIPRLMVLNAEDDKAEIQERKAEVMKGCKDATRELKLKIMSEKDEYDSALKARMKRIKEEFDVLTESLPQAEKQKISLAVKSGIEKSEDMIGDIDDF